MEPEYSIFFDRPSVFAKDKEEKILKDIALSLLIKLAQADLLHEGDEDKAEIVNQGVLAILDKYKLNLLIIDKDIMSFIADKAISKFSYYSLTRPCIKVYDYVDVLEKEYRDNFTFDKEIYSLYYRIDEYEDNYGNSYLSQHTKETLDLRGV